MGILTAILIAYVALFHLGAFVLESCVWKTGFAMKIFGTTPETASTTYPLALNQGVYNLFLASGLVWSLIAVYPLKFELEVFFLSCVIIAAVTAGLSVSRRIMLLQGLPAAIALLLVLFK